MATYDHRGQFQRGNLVTLTGTQFNGISEGSTYGDDIEMSSNYPIVMLTDLNGNSFYVRTFNWSSTGVATGSTPVSVQFVLPAGRLPGLYGVTVIANGIASHEEFEDLSPSSISDVAQLRGDSGLTDFVFTVKQPSNASTTTYNYATADGTAVAGSDYIATSGTVTFLPGETTKQVTVEVIGKAVVESDETFFVNLIDPTTAALLDRGTGTILNDLVGATINNVT